MDDKKVREGKTDETIDVDVVVVGGGAGMAAVLLFTYRKKVDALKMPAWMKGIPAQMILLGIIYAVLSLFK